MGPGAAARKVEESIAVTYALIDTFRVEGGPKADHPTGPGPGVVQRRVGRGSQADHPTGPGVIQRRVGRGCEGGTGPNLDQGKGVRREEMERLALADRALEDAIEETDYAKQSGHGGGTQERASPEQATALAEEGVGNLIEVEGWREKLTRAGPLKARGIIPTAMATYNRLHSNTQCHISFPAHVARLLAVPQLTVMSSFRDDDRLVNYRPLGGLGTHRQLWGWDSK
ncbi:hypothetical protein CYMTET_48290 [Cymbomonas tetramitiformis]|uniref:Uncharacterized protein n=1 Tax=Cymbomonas tetramitiformis TaxID=36881 RepID=A0AAE0BTU9_9CHLO|nr:hypothetical protein CYMTET_48290 [Cymbomonas tetramitiformis]